MSKKRTCKRCHSPLSDMDPHTICKSCRQPDPQMFYCSEEDCEACSVIKVYKPLDLLLRKQELENMAKKLNPIGNFHPKQEEIVPKKKKPDTAGKSSPVSIPLVSSLEDKGASINQDIVNSILKGFCKEKTIKTEPLEPQPSTSYGNENEGFKDLEKRLFDRIMSTLMTSISSETKPSTPEISSRPSAKSPKLVHLPTQTQANKIGKKAPVQKVLASSTPHESPDLSSNEDELEDSLISLFSAINPDSLAKGNKGSNENGKNDYIFKVSSHASDILLNRTVLSSPSQASYLSQELDIKDPSYWPHNLNAANVLHSNFTKLPVMKLHPKVRHMHNILFGKLNPSLPQELIGDNFSLPLISVELKNEFYFAREQLQRLLLMFSIVDYYSAEKIVQENPSLNTVIELLLNQLKVSLEKQANFVGLLFQEIKRDLLTDTECKEPEAVTKLIMGPANHIHFFGPYVKELKDIVQQKGSSFSLTSKSENVNVNLFKLPIKFKEGDSAYKFLTNLKVYFEANLTKESDKVAIFESLLPDLLINRLINFVKPKKLGDKSFEDLAHLFKKFDLNNCQNYLQERQKFCQMKQLAGQSVESFAEILEATLAKCLYGSNSREMLRDQFVFGLCDEAIKTFLIGKFSWCFEECLQYAMNKQTRENEYSSSSEGSKKEKAPVKRKVEETNSLTKKLKTETDFDAHEFYNKTSYSKSCDEILKINNLQQWNEHFGFEVKYTFQVCCPWTGQTLRS